MSSPTQFDGFNMTTISSISPPKSLPTPAPTCGMSPSPKNPNSLSSYVSY